MNLLFLLERVNFSLLQGDSVYCKRFIYGLKEAGNQIECIAHGKLKGIKMHSPGSFKYFTQIKTIPVANHLVKKNVDAIINQKNFDALFVCNLICTGDNFWYRLPQPFTLKESAHLKHIRMKAKEKGIKLFYRIEGITERNSFPAFFAGSTKEAHLNELNKCDGIVTLSKAQDRILQEKYNVSNEFLAFPPSVDTQKFRKIKRNNFIKQKYYLPEFCLLYFSSTADGKELERFFDVLALTSKEVNLIINSNPTPKLLLIAEKKKVAERVKFIGKIPDGEVIPLMSYCKAGVYLKKFNLPLGDASFMVKISEYMASGLPVIVPEMSGPIKQAGRAGIVLSEDSEENAQKINSLLSENFRRKLSNKACEIAEKDFDLKKNSLKLNRFIKGIVLR
ncbi:MAG: glycosyltransferase [Candidatus Diapherotrites archaeon]